MILANAHQRAPGPPERGGSFAPTLGLPRVKESMYFHVKNNDSESGFTVHYVNKDYDEGDIIFQKSIKVATDEPKTLAKKVLIEEHKYYPEIIKKILYD